MPAEIEKPNEAAATEEDGRGYFSLPVLAHAVAVPSRSGKMSPGPSICRAVHSRLPWRRLSYRSARGRRRTAGSEAADRARPRDRRPGGRDRFRRQRFCRLARTSACRGSPPPAASARIAAQDAKICAMRLGSPATRVMALTPPTPWRGRASRFRCRTISIWLRPSRFCVPA